MKKLFLLLVVAAGAFQLSAQTTFTALKISPEFIKANEKLTFEYNAGFSPLVKEKKIDAVVYLFNSFNWKAVEPVLAHKGKIYTGTINVDSNTTAIAFAFSGAEEKDLNSGK